MLTDPPESAHAEIAVRYVPALHEAQVGGDWYDAFISAAGDVVLAIGDVVGHDTQAAPAMGQVRGLLRGIAYTTGQGPAAVLQRLDEAIDGLKLEAIATAITCVLTQGGAAGAAELRWSNAGHPPPIVLAPDGSTRLLDGIGDLMLGVWPLAKRRETVTTLAPGSIVFLYTDGLVERRGADLNEDDVAVLGLRLR